jgi:HAD superfamily hydrolase (TIGR01450 family)
VATWALDLDGVLWRGAAPIPGAAEAVGRLRARGERVVFLTNNSGPTLAGHVDKLRRMGVEAAPEEVLTSAQAAATMLDRGATALACAGDGVREALAARGVRVVASGAADAVVVGFHREFDFERLARAADAVRAGARLIGTNEDATYPTPDGLLPGAGALLAAVACASGAVPEVAGKPHGPMRALVAERVGAVATVVGDRPSTDGALAQALGARFALVLSGVTGEGELARLRPPPDEVAADLGALVPSAPARPHAGESRLGKSRGGISRASE